MATKYRSLLLIKGILRPQSSSDSSCPHVVLLIYGLIETCVGGKFYITKGPVLFETA